MILLSLSNGHKEEVEDLWLALKIVALHMQTSAYDVLISDEVMRFTRITDKSHWAKITKTNRGES